MNQSAPPILRIVYQREEYISVDIVSSFYRVPELNDRHDQHFIQ